MFKRPRHQAIRDLLEQFDSNFLLKAKTYFGCGTAIVLLHNEYRESLDIDFFCSSRQGFRSLRNEVSSNGFGRILQGDIKLIRAVRCERDKISSVATMRGNLIKIEFIFEGNIDIDGLHNDSLKVPVLCKEDMFATKLLANADHGLDPSTLNRDIIDLAMMAYEWQGIPSESWQKAYEAYGDAVFKGFEKAKQMVCDPARLRHVLHEMKMDPQVNTCIVATLDQIDPFKVSQSMKPV